MFEEKVTAAEFKTGLGDLEYKLEDRLQTQDEIIEKLVAASDIQDRRLDRYSNRLTQLIIDLDRTKRIIDHNAEQGEKANGAIREAYSRIDELKSASELLATELGKEITVLPEVPAEITIQPGLPERLGLESLSAADKKAANKRKGTQVRDSMSLPAPVTLTADELNSGLSLVR